MAITQVRPVITRKAAGFWDLVRAIRNRWTQRMQPAPSEQIMGGLSLSPEAWNLVRENDCNSARLLEPGEICICGPERASINFGEITPEDIIGPGVPDRDWSQRSDREKPVHHLHVSFAGEPDVIVCAEVNTDDEAGCAAIDEALGHLRGEGIWDEDKIAGWEQIACDEGYCLHLYHLGEYCGPDGCCPGIRVEAT